MISMKWYFEVPFLISSNNGLAKVILWATATFTIRSPIFMQASLTPSSPRTAWYSIVDKSSLVKTSATVRNAASITPPLAPKITPAPVYSPNISWSKSSSFKSRKLIPNILINLPNSLVVNTASTSFKPSVRFSSRSFSPFLATHGMIETT